MGEYIYIRIDDMSVQDNETRDMPIKPFDENILNATFREVIDRMIDTKPDPLTNHCYNSDEIRFITGFKERYINALNQDNSRIEILATKDGQDNGPYTLNDRLGDYTSDILQVIEKEEDGTVYRSIDLLVNPASGGSNLDTYMHR